MRMGLIATSMLIAMVVPGVTLGADWFTSTAIEKIRQELGPGCQVSLKNIGQTVSGNNGLRQEQWFVKTCHGVEQYWVSYFPPRAFPDRTTDLEVQKVTGKAG